jgi:hypothetical protein
MSPLTRRKALKPKQTNTPSIRLVKVEHKSPSSSPDELIKQEMKTLSQELTETQKNSKSADSNGESSPKYGSGTPENKGISQTVEKPESTKITCSQSFGVKKPKTTVSSEKVDKCGYSMQADYSSFEFKKEGNKVPSEQTKACPDLEMMNVGQYQSEDTQLKECDSTGSVDPSSVKLEKPGVSSWKPKHSEGASREDARLRELKRLQQRCRELDNEREALMLAIGKEVGLTANMQQLHEYNAIKDITQIVIGSLSNVLDIPVTQLHQELNLSFEK